MLKIAEIREMDETTIKKTIDDTRVGLFDLMLQKTTTGLDTPNKMKEAKKDIARLNTILNEKDRK